MIDLKRDPTTQIPKPGLSKKLLALLIGFVACPVAGVLLAALRAIGGAG